MNNIVKLVIQRKSIRTYTSKPLSNEIKSQIEEYFTKLDNPWGVKINYTLIETKGANTNEKLGTYGVIRNASSFIAATLFDSEFALEALGFELEVLILYLTGLGIGTCWLGGTFNRGEFAKEAKLKEGQIIPIITPIGYPAKKTSLTDKLMRKMSKGDSRKEWNQLFFLQDFSTELTKKEAGFYSDALEMVRLAPSASNKQPWRIIKETNTYHFFEYSTPGYSKTFNYDIQRIDMGIAAAHFQLTIKDKAVKGEFAVLEQQIIAPENTHYKFSWIGEREGEVIMGELKEIYLAGGCFWGTEKYLSLVNGVISTEVGYANGNTIDPTYNDVCHMNTGHTETVKVVYDSQVISLTDILLLFYDVIDPTSIDRQGNDVGSQYRSGIYYTDESDKEIIFDSIAQLRKEYKAPVVIEVLPLSNYTKAEEYHQKYLEKNPKGYCHIGEDKFKNAKERN